MKGATRDEWVKTEGLEGAEAPFAGYAGLRLLPQGKVVGKRVGFSETLGPNAWEAWSAHWHTDPGLLGDGLRGAEMKYDRDWLLKGYLIQNGGFIIEPQSSWPSLDF